MTLLQRLPNVDVWTMLVDAVLTSCVHRVQFAVKLVNMCGCACVRVCRCFASTENSYDHVGTAREREREREREKEREGWRG